MDVDIIYGTSRKLEYGRTENDVAYINVLVVGSGTITSEAFDEPPPPPPQLTIL